MLPIRNVAKNATGLQNPAQYFGGIRAEQALNSRIIAVDAVARRKDNSIKELFFLGVVSFEKLNRLAEWTPYGSAEVHLNGYHVGDLLLKEGDVIFTDRGAQTASRKKIIIEAAKQFFVR